MPATSSRHELAKRLGLVDRVGDSVLTALTRVAVYVTGADAAAVHILDDRYQHRIASTGEPLGQTPVEDSLCLQVVGGQQRIVCTDAVSDPRFAYSSFVTGDSPVRFYAGVPLRVAEGVVVGTLCAFGDVPRSLTAEQTDRLDDLALQAEFHLELVHLAVALGQASTRDEAGGGLPRALFDERLAEILAGVLRDRLHAVVLVLDVSSISGENTDPRILRAFTETLAGAAGTQSAIGRLRGDELGLAMVLESQELPTPRSPVVTGAVARLHTAAAAAAGAPVQIGAAIASADDDVRSVLRRADRALLEARHLDEPWRVL